MTQQSVPRAEIQEAENYDVLAAEYYDPVRHPTCADLRAASRHALRDFLDRSPPTGLDVVELGAGRSVVAELYTEAGWALSRLTITDASSAMLAHSAGWKDVGPRLVLGAAADLNLLAGSADIVVASLGDPYNDQALWHSVRQLLRSGGRAFYTTPSFEWARQFRPLHQHGPEHTAEFLVAGRLVYVPSVILPEEQQVVLIESAGLRVRVIGHVRIRDLPGGIRSPKLLTPLGDGLAFLTTYVAEKY